MPEHATRRDTPSLGGEPPLVNEAEAAARRPLPAPEVTPLRILLIDDDRIDRMAVGRALRSAGFEFEASEADSMAAGLRELVARTFDCVFLDFLLPDGDGLDVVRAARERGVRTPIVILTGQGDEQIAVELMKAGASDYMPKAQATAERLSQVLRNALRVHRAEHQAARAERERARLLVMEQRAREEAEAAQQRLAFLAEASALVSASLDYGTTLENVARLAVPSLADWCFLDLLDADLSFTRMAVAHRDPAQAELARRFRRTYAPMPEAPHGISRVIALGESEIMTEMPDWVLLALARDADHLDALRALNIQSLMCVPLIARGRNLGAMTFISTGERPPYSLDDLSFAEEIARRAALAVDNARLYRGVKAAEEQLRMQLDFTSAITDSLAEGVCALDAEGCFTFVNPVGEQLLGFSSEELLGRRLHAIIHSRQPGGPPVAEEECPLFRAVREGRVLRKDDDYFTRRDGSFLPVSWVTSPIVSNGRLVGAVLAFHDSTARKRAEAELEDSRRQLAQSEKLSALGTLVSGVAHELRTPLTYLTNNIFLLQARLESTAKENPSLKPVVADALRFGQAAMEGVDRINALVKDLRPFANPEGGRRIEAGLHEVVQGAVDLFRATHRGHVEVDAVLEPTPPLLLERGQLQRVAINLLMNAAEAMPHGGRIRITTRPLENGALLEVEDEGSGIPPEVEARIFDPFFTTKADGTGLGLSITRRIVEAHGGTIRYQTRQGRGTRFLILLPQPSKDAQLDAGPRSLSPAASAPNP